MFTTLLNWAGTKPPSDRVIDGVDQSFFEGKSANPRVKAFLSGWAMCCTA